MLTREVGAARSRSKNPVSMSVANAVALTIEPNRIP